jgi:hypothetical protein
MTPNQYRQALIKLGLTNLDVAPILGIGERHSQRLAATGPVPHLIAKVLQLLIAGKLKMEDLQ